MNTNERDKQQPVGDGGGRKFNLGELVTKTKGSSWTGRVVGFYSTKLTPVGYAVESTNEPGSVQIYPEAALATAKQGERVQGVEVTDEMAAKVLSDYMCEIHGCVAFAPNRASIDAMRQAMKRALIDSTSAQGIENLPSPERGRYFAHGPIGYFFTDDLQLATAILVAYDKDDDWTVTDLHNPYGIDSASGAGEVERG